MLYTVTFDGIISIDNIEVSEIKWVTIEGLKLWMKEKPNEFTGGFLHAFKYYLTEPRS